MFFDKFLEKKWHYFILLGIVFFYLRSTNLILNFKFSYKIFLFILCSIIIFYINKGKANIYGKVFISMFYGFFLNLLVLIPINYYIILNSKNNFVETKIFPITNYISSRTNKVYFDFLGENYGIGFKNVNNLERNFIIKNCKIQLQYSKSLLGTYVINEANVINP